MPESGAPRAPDFYVWPMTKTSFPAVLLLPAFLILPLQVGAVPSIESPVAQWNFEEGAGTTAKGTSSSELEGSITGAAWTEGHAGKALEFSGDDSVLVPYSSRLDLNAFTLSAWVYCASVESDAQVMGKFSFDEGGYFLALGQHPVFAAGFGGAGGNIFLNGEADSAEWLGKWAHLAATYDGKNMSLYLNGVELSDINGYEAWTDIEHTSGPLVIGKGFKGKIDEIVIYGRDLAPAEIADLYAGKPIYDKTTSIAAHAPSFLRGRTGSELRGLDGRVRRAANGIFFRP
jgi:hypothetical protein